MKVFPAQRSAIWLSLALGFISLIVRVSSGEEISYNRDIRPLLSDNCFYCHGQDANKRMADLRLDQAEAALEYGAIVPGSPEDSLLVERITSDDPDLQMPPPKSNRRLSDDQKDLLRRWIGSGAKYEPHWAYTTVESPAVPDVVNFADARAETPIDAFVLAKQQQRQLPPNSPAARRSIIRRVYLDLAGLLPPPNQVEQFVIDDRPDAYERLIERLLADPAYGERMSLSWLDAARYADSNGFQQDGDTFQWVWRDWVVDALNASMPFDRFSIEQLAGDLLPDPTTDQLIATAFNRNHLLNGEGGAIAEEQRFNNLFDRMNTTATTWLGMTMACAQCHDHKYDPITQRDYYSLMAAFNKVSENGMAPGLGGFKHRVAEPYIEVSSEENRRRVAELKEEVAEAKRAADWDTRYQKAKDDFIATASADNADLPQTARDILKIQVAERSDEDRRRLSDQLGQYFVKKVWPPAVEAASELKAAKEAQDRLRRYEIEEVPRVMVMNDAQARPSHILDRGVYTSPTEPVEFATPAFLPPLPGDAPKNRLGFAQWLFLPDNPLTARVATNRLWQEFFGIGLVKTVEDMGVQSQTPLHRDLFDYLASEYMRRGWDTKLMVRLLLTSSVYRQDSRVRPDHLEMDPENSLLARAARFRSSSLLLRDAALQLAGLLDRQIGGRPVYPYQPEDVWEPLAITKERDFTYPSGNGRDLYRRSLYTFWRRTIGPANMFDTSPRQTCTVRAARTSTPLHALTTLNDVTFVEAARVWADRLLADRTPVQAVLQAFCEATGRPASEAETRLLTAAYARQLEHFSDGGAEDLLAVGETSIASISAEHAAAAAVCLLILNLDETLTRQ